VTTVHLIRYAAPKPMAQAAAVAFGQPLETFATYREERLIEVKGAPPARLCQFAVMGKPPLALEVNGLPEPMRVKPIKRVFSANDPVAPPPRLTPDQIMREAMRRVGLKRVGKP
jgi:hypothetical protein